MFVSKYVKRLSFGLGPFAALGSRNQEYVDEYLKLKNAGDEVKETLASCRDTLQDCDAEIVSE